MHLYTWGYDSRSLADLLAVVHRYQINLVVDCRRRRRSSPQWRAAALRATLGDRYVWVRELGNCGPGLVDEARGLVQLHNLLRIHGTVLLLCVEQRPVDCHRHRIAAALRQRIWDLRITHL